MKGEWAKIVAPIVAKFEVGAKIGDGVKFNRDGAEALGKLLKDMASRLDEAAEWAERSEDAL